MGLLLDSNRLDVSGMGAQCSVIRTHHNNSIIISMLGDNTLIAITACVSGPQIQDSQDDFDFLDI